MLSLIKVDMCILEVSEYSDSFYICPLIVIMLHAVLVVSINNLRAPRKK